MTDYVRQAIARTLGVKLFHVGSWRLDVGSDAMDFIVGHVGGSLRAEMRVQFHYDAYQAIQTHWHRDQGAIKLTPQVDMGMQEYLPRIDCLLTLLYGKETQHIFKALHQAFTVRGPQQKRKNKHART